MPKPPGHDFRETMRLGMQKYPEKAWVIPFQDPTIMLPHGTLEAHLKKIPEPHVTLNGNMYRRFFGAYTQVGTDDSQLVDALKFDLTRNVHSLLPEMANEIAYGFESVVGKPTQWAAFLTYPTMLQIVALTSGRVFVGLPLSRDPEWVQASIQHTIGSVSFSDRLRLYPAWLRRMVAPFLPERRAVDAVQATVARLLAPILTQRLSRLQQEQQRDLAPRSNADGKDSDIVGRMTGWLLGHYRKGNLLAEATPARLVRDHLTLAFAAVHVGSMALSHIIHDLAARPESVSMLRLELEAESKSCAGQALTTKSLANLSKMDSFIKESLRLSPSGTVAWTRLTTKDMALDNGQVIPSDSMIAYCNPRFNPNLELFENSEAFDGLRFFNLIQRHGPKASFNLDSVSTDSLGFGYGIHACPGRSFAAAELKLVVAHLIQHYDLKLAGNGKRPENIYMDFQIMPDPGAQVMLRSRSSSLAHE